MKLGDTVIVTIPGRNYGKMCTITELPQTNRLLPVKVQVINPHDDFGYGVMEKWIPIACLQQVERS